MSEGMNRCIFIGRLGQNSELRYTQDGTPLTSFRMACGERYRNPAGEWQERTEWVPCVLFGKRAEGINKYLLKGTLVNVEGSLRTRKYTNQSGVTQYVTEIRVSHIRLLAPGANLQEEETPAENPQNQDSDDFSS